MPEPGSTNRADLRVQLCGRFAFIVAGRPVQADLPGRQARMLLAYLAAHRDRPAARAQLLDDLWPDRAAAAGATLSVVLSKVRALIPPAEIGGRDALQLILPAGAIVDIERAAESLHQAESALAQGDFRRAWGPSLTAQLTAGRGFLVECDEAWTGPIRARVDLIHQRGLACYAEACAALGGTELPAAERAARRLVAQAPLSEIGHRLLMEVLAKRGDTAGALMVYEQLRHAVREELGVDPGPEARLLHRQLLHATTDID
jgi:SARP family transcriptional regulator, regulator of embCAB operon